MRPVVHSPSAEDADEILIEVPRCLIQIRPHHYNALTCMAWGLVPFRLVSRDGEKVLVKSRLKSYFNSLVNPVDSSVHI